MKIKDKIIWGYLSIFTIAILSTYFEFKSTQSIKEKYDDVIEHTVPIQESLQNLKLAGLNIISSTHEVVDCQSAPFFLSVMGNKFEYFDFFHSTRLHFLSQSVP